MLDEDRVGNWVHTVAQDCGIRFALGIACAGFGDLPANFFRGNPFAPFTADSVGNHSRSDYNGLQIEFRRRMTNGLMVQSNYTFGKVLSDSDGSQSNFDPALDIRQPEFDRKRATFDITHQFNFIGIYELPVGRGRGRISEGIIGKVLEGWQLGGIWTYRSGENTGVFSSRGTLNRDTRSRNRNPATLLGMNTGAFCSKFGAKVQGAGVFLVPDEFRDLATGRANSAILGHPGAGQLGTQSLRSGCNGPNFRNVDFNIVKRTYFTETANVEFRFELFNAFNFVNYNIGSVNSVTSGSFGRIRSTVNDAREIQFNLRINF